MALVVALALSNTARAQPAAGDGYEPVSQRTGEVGCWIIADEPWAN